MMQLYVLSFLAGLLAANGVPHFVMGIAGRTYRTPFGLPSSGVVNVFWGWLNFVLAVVSLHFAHPWSHLYRASALFALAVLLMAMLLAYSTTHAHQNIMTHKDNERRV